MRYVLDLRICLTAPLEAFTALCFLVAICNTRTHQVRHTPCAIVGSYGPGELQEGSFTLHPADRYVGRLTFHRYFVRQERKRRQARLCRQHGHEDDMRLMMMTPTNLAVHKLSYIRVI
ncbi:hypothetical protein QBC43DRAFT_93433 [Cladorrhinum sp. PSN259]|nr:hypothetical protein QBC43DRAFT_93433 [Cladorrhinum sp. PSN259]